MSLKGAAEKGAEALGIIADELDRLGAQLRGIHGAIGQQHSESQVSLDELKNLILGMRGDMRNVQTAVLVVADLTSRMRVIEAALNLHADNGNGTA